MEIFDWQGIDIRQSDEVHKVGTDAVLLGGWIQQIISSADQVLDAGTGTGILAIHTARIFPNAKITAIDVQEQAITLANLNALHSGFGERIIFLQGNLLQQNGLPKNVFDLVISNPPFFQSEMRPAERSKQQAKHLDMPVGHWVKALCDCTSEDGHLCIIIPAEDALSWIAAANQLGWYVARKANVFSFAYDAMPKRSMVHFTRTLRSPVFQRINIYAEEKRYSQEYLGLTGLRPAGVK